MNTHKIGGECEQAACDYLAGKGATVLARNVSLNGGEIDIVARVGEYTAFIEVKARKNGNMGLPSGAVTKAKQRKIIKAATAYAAMNNLLDEPLRFDVIEIMPGHINHIEAAFDASN